MAGKTCRICDGMGMRIVERADGYPLAELCECRVQKRNVELLRRSHIPERYKTCTLDNYQYDYKGANPSLYHAYSQARNFAQRYLLQPKGLGLLFTGTIGTGKTHLAVGILQELVTNQGVRALFCDQGELLRSVTHSFHKNASVTQMEVLTPIIEAELLVLDELGRFKKSEWVSDLVAHVLNVRYSNKLTTIITTNYPNRHTLKTGWESEAERYEAIGGAAVNQRNGTSEMKPIDEILDRIDLIRAQNTSPASLEAPATSTAKPRSGERESNASAASTKASASARIQARLNTEETLGDRIGEHMRSRLSEMCVTIEMVGEDYRDGRKKARFQ